MRKLLIAFLVVFSLFAISCEIGLGSAVDTEPPAIEISIPPVDSVIRDNFAIGGTWSDDGVIGSISVKLSRTDGKGEPLTLTGEFVEDEHNRGTGTWSTPVSISENNVLDGTYQAVVTIKDTVGRTTIQSTTFTVDNTAPLIVLQRPGTKLTETADAYGQTFTLNGMGADDNSIDHIDINIYSDVECTNLLKTITKSNVPPTIELAVAVFEDGVENDYATIYGSTGKNGMQTRYCTITAYDNAKRYPLTGEMTAADQKGNSTSFYYLYDDIYDSILDNYTITDVYKMLSGTYLLADSNRSADTVANVKALLGQFKITEGNFSLNPENNPQFIVNGRDPLTKSGSDFAGSDYNITSGTSVVVEISTGLDGIPLEPSTLRPYLLLCDANGDPQVEDVAENRIYLAEAGSGTKSGTSYKYTVNFNHTTAYPNGKFIYLGNTYIIRVEGHDKNRNTIMPKGGAYGFKLSSNGAAPGLTVTKPATTISYVKANGKQTFEGIITSQDGFPTITIKNGTTVVWTKTFTHGDETTVNGILRFDFSHDIDYNGVTENSQIQYTVVASMGDLETTTFKTVIYDKDAPTVSLNEPSPIAAKYITDDPDNEDNTLVGENYLNGNVKLKVSINDEYDAVDTETEGKKPYFEIINAQTNAVIPIKLEASSHVVEESEPTEKHYVTRLVNGEFIFNTAGEQGIADNTPVKFKFHAWDRAGNEIEYSYPEASYDATDRTSYYIVDQSTDTPVILPNDEEISLLLTSKALRDARATAWTDQNRTRRAQVPSGNQFMIKMIDDDGIKSWEIYRATIDSSNEGELANQVADDRFTLDSSSGNTSLNSKEITKSVTVQTTSGYYWYKIKVVDKNNKEFIHPVFIVKVTTAAPSITLSAVTTDTDPAVGEYVGATGATKTKWKNKIEIDSSEESFTLYRAVATIDSNGNYVEPAEADYEIITTADSKTINDVIERGSYESNQRFYYYVRDNNGNKGNIKYITCKYDGVAPTLAITGPDDTKKNTNAINSSPYQFRGTITEDKSISSIYYKVVAANADGSYTAPSNESWTGWTSVSPEANWSFYRDIGSANGAIAEGKYKIYMYALDGAGNCSTCVDREFHVDMAAPVVTATAPEYVNYSTNIDHSRKVTITGTVVETHGIASFYIKRNDQAEPGTSVAIDDNGEWTYENTPENPGTYTYTITATDKVGKTNTTLTKTVTVDVTAPSVDAAKITTPTSTQTENEMFKFEGQAGCVSDNEGGSGLDKVELAFTTTNSEPTTKQTDTTPVLTGDAIGSWASTVEFANTTFGGVFSSEGTKYIWVKVYDKAGNSSAWTPKEFLYDTGVPGFNLTATTPAADSYKNTGFTIEGRATDSYGIGSVVIKGQVELTDTPDDKWANAYTNYYINEACTTAAPETFAAGTYYVKQTLTTPATITTSTDGRIQNALYSKAFRVGTETTENAILLVDGSYNFIVTATDLSGKSKTESRRIIIDTTEPDGTFDTDSFYPEGNSVGSGANARTWYNSNSITITVNVTEANISTVKISKDNSTFEPMLLSNEKYTATVRDLTEGQNTIYVQMVDLATNNKIINLENLYVDTNAPNLSINENTILTYMGTTGFTVTGEVSDAGTTETSVTGSGIGNSGLRVKEEHRETLADSWAETADSSNSNGGAVISVTGGTWSQDLPLNPANLQNGYYRYTFILTDNAGNQTSEYKTTIVDTTPPVITISNPGENAKTNTNAINTSPYQFSGSITETNTVSAIYYKVVAANADGSFTAPSNESWTGWTSVSSEKDWSFYRDIGTADGAIGEDKYKIYMYALDGAGNCSTCVDREFHVDMAAPVVTATAPTYVNYSTNTDHSRKVTITGTVVETHGIASFYIKRNDQAAPGTSVAIGANGNWTYEDTPTADGTYTYTIVATDKVEKTNTTLTKTVIIDTVAPSVVAANIIVPTNGSQTEGTHFKFEGGTGCVADNNGGSGLDKVEIAFTSTNSAPSTKQVEATPVTTGDTIGSWASTVEFANATFGSVFGSEGTKYIWVKVYDKAGNSSAWTSKEFLYDTGAPGLTLTATTPVTNSYRNSGFTIEGRATDSYGIGSVVIKGHVELTDTPDNWENAYTNYYTDQACTTPAPATFAAGTYYVKQTAATTATAPVLDALYSKAFRAGTETTENAVLLVDGSYDFTVTATDLSGKTASENRTITIEREQPNLNNIKLITGVDQANNDIEAYRQSESSPYFINNTTSTDLKISGVATDNIGINSVTISIDGYNYTGSNTGSNARWKFEHINLSSITNVSGTDATATITVTDKAGNTNSDTVAICFDTSAPSGHHEVDSSEKDLFFRIGDNDNDDITSSHELWNAAKDTDVGKKYSDKTYGNSDTIEIRGNITDPQTVGSTEEDGSGVKMIYYHVFDRPVILDSSCTTDKQNVTGNGIIVNGVSTDNVPCWGFANETALTNWVISNKTGNFAPGTPVTKRVFYNVTGSDPWNGTSFTTTKYYKDVVTTYRASLSGFENSNNYLVIAAEDNVGNKGLDSATVTTDSGNLLKIFCQINKDVTPPTVELNENEESTRYHNASSTGASIVLHGTVTDDLAGINELKFRINGKFIPNEEANEPADKYGTISVNYTDDSKTSGTWTCTINPTALANISGDKPVYGIAKDNAGSGNSQTLSVATIRVDIKPPTVTITPPKNRGSTSDIQVNGTISLSGIASDRNGLREDTSTPTMKMYYTTSQTLSTNLTNALNAYNAPNSTSEYPTITIGDVADNGWKEIASATHDTSWTSSTINTQNLEKENQATTPVYFTATAIDTAGNTGYALPVAVIVNQNTDRPIISFSNISFEDPETGLMSSSNYVWLKNTTKVIGTISDDDDDETGTNALEISLTGSDSDWHTVTLNGSSFSYDLKTLYTATATQTQEQLANGPKTLYFRVTDKKNKQFTSATTNTTSALYLSDGTNTYGDAASGAQAGSIVYVKVDTQYPEVALLGARYIEAANTTETSNAAYSTTYSSFVIGETHRIFRVKFTAADTNGINNNSITGTATFPYGTGDSAESIIVNGSNLTVPTEQVDYYTLTFTLSDGDAALLKADEGYDGSVNVRISVSDAAGNATPQTATMAYDFKPSVAEFSFPDSSVSQSGEVEAYGSLSEAATVSYTISPSQTVSAGGSVTAWVNADGTSADLAASKTVEAWKPISDATGLNWTIHFDNKLSETNGTHSKSLNKYLIDYGIATKDSGSSAEDAIVSSFETFVKLYLWLKTVDHAGNEKKFVHQILVDPQGDKPNLQFSYPAANNGTLGGTISIYGTATDTKGSEANKIGVDSVWVQIKSTTHRAAEDTDTYGTSPTYASDTNTVSMALTEADLDYMVNNGYQVYKRRNYVVGAADSENNAFKWTTSSNLTAEESADDYAALATLNGAAWDIEINKNKDNTTQRSEFDPPEGTNSNPIAIRVYARDKDGKFSSKVDRYVSFDADTPVISDLKVVQSANGDLTSTATATKTYTPDMFLKGPWYLTGTITDNESIKELKVNGKTLITYTEPESEPNPVVRIVGGETEDTEDWRNAVSISGNDGGKTIKFKYPLFTVTQSGDISYSVPTTFTVSAKDKIKGNNAHPGSSSITINYDNTNPQVAEDEAHGLNIDTSIHQSNRWYKFGSKAMEPDDDNGTKQSGFAYTAFYFTRTSTNTLYDVLKDRNSAAISISGTIPILGSAGDTDNAIVTNNNLYWYHRTISNISGQTFTISNATAIRPSSLLQINGAFYLVTAVSGTSITVDSPVPAGSTVAYVAIAGIINNTTPEGDGTTIQTDGYYEAPSRDDGDRMIESVDKSGTTWAWEAKICSRNIPDGPIILHYVVFDKAGNSTTRTVSGMISNNQPRIAGAIVKTDFNGDGDVDDTGETINNYSTSLSYTSYYTGTKTTGTAPDTVTKNVFDPDENVKNTNAKNPLPTSTAYGSASEPITVLRGKTEIYPEIVGGNGALYYGYKVGDATTYTNNTTSPFITNGSTDYTVQTGIINIQHGDLIDFGDTTNAETGTPFVFKFWDSTSGGTRFDNAHPTQTAELTMYFAVQAQAVGDPWVKINPFYWNSLTDNSIYGSSTASAYKDLQGHIELEADWKTTTVYDADATSGLYDDDPKVSGKIVLSGTAHDDKLIKEMNANIFGTSVSIASYSGGALASTKAESAFATNHYWFEVVSQTIGSSGHDVNWKLYIDTATALSTVAGTDKTVTVTATNYGVPTATSEGITSETPGALPSMDGVTYYAGTLNYGTGNTNTPGTSQTAKTTDAQNNPVLTAYYKMDVVPYITKISTEVRNASGLKDNNIRSASGKYSILAGNTTNAITIRGFNFASGNALKAKIANTTTSAGRGISSTEGGGVDIAITGTNTSAATITNSNITKSGYLELFSNGVRALNNINGNNSYGTAKNSSNEQLTGTNATVTDYANAYNREPDYYTTKNVQLTDDRYLRFFDMKQTNVTNGYYPNMIMEGDDPVFGYIDNNGGGVNVTGAPASTAFFQRAKFNGSTGAQIYKEYLGKSLASDQMAMAKDQGGRYYQVSVSNYNGDYMSLYYDRFAQLHDNNVWNGMTGYSTFNGTSAITGDNNVIVLDAVANATGRFQYPKIIANGNSLTSTANVYLAYFDSETGKIYLRDFMIGKRQANSTYYTVYNNYNNITFTYSTTIDGNNSGFEGPNNTTDYTNNGTRYVKINGNYYQLTRQRYGTAGNRRYYYTINGYTEADTFTSNVYSQNTGTHLSGNESANEYQLYSGGVDNNNNAYEQYINIAEGTGNMGYQNYQGPNATRHTVIDAGNKYYDMGISNGHIVIVYYDDNSSRLKLRYSKYEENGANPSAEIEWVDSTLVFPEYVGSYVSLDVDNNGGIHISALDVTDSDLSYIYLSSYNAQNCTHITVDQFGSVGNWTEIKVNSTGIPYIAYCNATEYGQRDALRLAYPKNITNSLEQGIESSSRYTTGKWEYMTVPSITPAQGGDSKFQQVCLDFDSAGKPVVGYLGTNLEFGKWLDE